MIIFTESKKNHQKIHNKNKKMQNYTKGVGDMMAKRKFFKGMSLALAASMFLQGTIGIEEVFGATKEVASTSKVEIDASEIAQKIYQNRYKELVGSPVKDTETVLIGAIKELDNKISNENKTGFWDTLDKKAEHYLWSDLEIGSNSAHLANSFGKVYNMALAYNLPNSVFYQNEDLKKDILFALEWLNNNAYNKEMPGIYGNWFHFEIAIPMNITNILVLMRDEIEPKLMEEYLLAIDNFIPDPIKRKSLIQKNPEKINFDETGANLMDKSFVILMRGVLGNNKEKMDLGVKYVDSAFVIKENYGDLSIVGDNDGFYNDGSFVQHTNLAYTAGYGLSFLTKSAQYISALEGTRYMEELKNINNIFTIIEKNIAPVLYKGAIMDSTKGRGTSRKDDSDHLTGRKILINMYNIIKNCPDEAYVAKYKQFIKSMVLSDKSFENYMKGLSLPEVQALSELLNDETIVTTEDTRNEFLAMNFMKRYINHKGNYATSLSLFSDVISSFEYGNTENKKGFYQGAGVLHIYNDDLDQYSGNYYATIDMARLPGVTTDGQYGTLEEWKKYFNTYTYSGGSTDGIYGAIGFEFAYDQLTGSDLSGRKSWFFFDDEIVAVGSDINSTSGQPVETVVENRKLDSQLEHKVLVEGKEVIASETYKDAEWAYIEGNTEKTGIGYYFLQDQSITAEEKLSAGSWHDVNGYKESYTEDILTDKYGYLSIQHGVNPEGASYSYAILPNKTVEETKAYTNENNISVLLNDEKVHAVKENTQNIVGVNFFEPSTFEMFTAKNPLSLLVKATETGAEYYISDPTMQQDFIEIQVSAKEWSKYTAQANENVEVIIDEKTDSVTLKVDTSKKNGGTEKITLIKR